LALFDKPGDYAAFEKVLSEAHERSDVRIAAYCLMPNYWHLLLWPRADGELSEVMRWITVTQTQRRPFGSEDWTVKIAKQLGLKSTMNGRGGPNRS
jgi:REP element-mobilizing transposase RayT